MIGTGLHFERADIDAGAGREFRDQSQCPGAGQRAASSDYVVAVLPPASPGAAHPVSSAQRRLQHMQATTFHTTFRERALGPWPPPQGGAGSQLCDWCLSLEPATHCVALLCRPSSVSIRIDASGTQITRHLHREHQGRCLTAKCGPAGLQLYLRGSRCACEHRFLRKSSFQSRLSSPWLRWYKCWVLLPAFVRDVTSLCLAGLGCLGSQNQPLPPGHQLASPPPVCTSVGDIPIGTH